MAKGQQRSNKEVKKTKKDAPSKVIAPISGAAPMPKITGLSVERGKKKVV